MMGSTNSMLLDISALASASDVGQCANWFIPFLLNLCKVIYELLNSVVKCYPNSVAKILHNLHTFP